MTLSSQVKNSQKMHLDKIANSTYILLTSSCLKSFPCCFSLALVPLRSALVPTNNILVPGAFSLSSFSQVNFTLLNDTLKSTKLYCIRTSFFYHLDSVKSDKTASNSTLFRFIFEEFRPAYFHIMISCITGILSEGDFCHPTLLIH